MAKKAPVLTERDRARRYNKLCRKDWKSFVSPYEMGPKNGEKKCVCFSHLTRHFERRRGSIWDLLTLHTKQNFFRFLKYSRPFFGGFITPEDLFFLSRTWTKKKIGKLSGSKLAPRKLGKRTSVRNFAETLITSHYGSKQQQFGEPNGYFRSVSNNNDSQKVAVNRKLFIATFSSCSSSHKHIRCKSNSLSEKNTPPKVEIQRLSGRLPKGIQWKP